MQLIVITVVAFVTAAAGFLLAAVLASGAREDAFRAGYRAGMHAASLALSRIAEGIASDGPEQREDERAH
jgi:hypothetical protein